MANALTCLTTTTSTTTAEQVKKVDVFMEAGEVFSNAL